MDVYAGVLVLDDALAVYVVFGVFLAYLDDIRIHVLFRVLSPTHVAFHELAHVRSVFHVPGPVPFPVLAPSEHRIVASYLDSKVVVSSLLLLSSSY